MYLPTRQKMTLVILLVFATVAPVSVHGEDTVYINNSVQSSVSTGGYSSDGASGQDGTVGASGMGGHDGADGASGAAGTSGRIIDGNSSAHVEVISNVPDANVATHTATSTHEAGASATASLHTTLESSGAASTTSMSETPSVLQNFVLKIREFFLTYVSIF